MAVERNFLRDTATEPGTDGTLVFDLSTTQGSPVSTLTGSLNDTVFTEVLRFQRTVDDTVAGTSFPTSINISSLSGTVDVRWRVQRINSSGVVQASSAYSATVSTSGIKTETLSLSTTWATGDRLALSIEIARTGGHGSVSVNVEAQDADSFIDPDMATGPQTIAVGAAPETETAQTVTVQTARSVAVSSTTETEVAQAIVVASTVTVAVGEAVESEAAQVVTPIADQTVAVGEAVETEVAQTVTGSTTGRVAELLRHPRRPRRPQLGTPSQLGRQLNLKLLRP